jgi:hypothetical protein
VDARGTLSYAPPLRWLPSVRQPPGAPIRTNGSD